MTEVFVVMPRDGLFLKDGREWAASASGHAHSLHWPFPSTTLGAMRTAFGLARKEMPTPAQWATLAKEVTLGCTVALRRPMRNPEESWVARHRCWPVPTDALYLKKEPAGMQVLRLDPHGSDHGVQTLGRSDRGDEAAAREALWRPTVDDQAKPGKAPIWWSDETFVDWLSKAPTEAFWRDDLAGVDMPRRIQAHVGIDPTTKTHRPQILFAHDIIETMDCEEEKQTGPAKIVFAEWALGCEIELASSAAKRPVPKDRMMFGGGRAPAAIEQPKQPLFVAPKALNEAFGNQPKGLRLVAVTPLVFKRAGWIPDEFSPNGSNGEPLFVGTMPALGKTKLILRSALVPRPWHVSGWDIAAGAPKPTTRLTPPGAVYFLVREDGKPFGPAEAKKLWFAALGDRIDEGYGRVVPGVWNPKE